LACRSHERDAALSHRSSVKTGSAESIRGHMQMASKKWPSDDFVTAGAMSVQGCWHVWNVGHVDCGNVWRYGRRVKGGSVWEWCQLPLRSVGGCCASYRRQQTKDNGGELRRCWVWLMAAQCRR